MRRDVFLAWAERCLRMDGTDNWGFYSNSPLGAVDGPEYRRVREFWSLDTKEIIPQASANEKALFLLFVAEAEAAR